jgi:hypothetical protein
MEAIYKHKQSGATQIMSDVTVEVLGTDEWEYLSEVDYDSENISEEKETPQPKKLSEPEKPRVSEVLTDETPKSETSKTENKPTNPKAVSSKDLE